MSLYELAGLDGPAGLKEKKPPAPISAPLATPATATAWSGSVNPPDTAAGRRKPALAPAVGFKPMALSKKPAGACNPNCIGGGGAAAGSGSHGAAAGDAGGGGASGGATLTAGPSCAPAMSETMGVRGWYVDIKVPYDPGEPNEYEDWAREAEAKRKAAAIEEALKKKQAILATAQSAAAAALEGGARRPPPPPPFASGDALAEPAPAPPPPPVPGFADETGDPGLAMMRAMGWQEGKGLGSLGQGMITPLIARKTTSVSAVIENAEERPRKPPPPPPLPTHANAGPGPGGGAGGGEKKGSVTFRGRPSRVLLLKNMVGPGEVDDDLRGEIGEECSRFGEVLDVVVRELPAEIEDPAAGGGAGGEGGAAAGAVRRLSEDERVRIFVKFAKQASAMKAYIELDGRYFGGRNVWVCFFREVDFDAGSFAPSAREPK